MRKQSVYKKRRISAKQMIVSLRVYYVFIFTFFILSASLYLYFLFASIYYTSVSKDTQLMISVLHSDLSELEASYVREYKSIVQLDFKKDFVIIKDDEKEFAKLDTYIGRAD